MLMRRLSIALAMILLFSFSAFAVEMSVETVDEGSTQGYSSSLAIDEDGNPHISFKADSQILKYAYFDGDEWVTQNVVEGSSYINQTSIALDSEGNPCIAFQRGAYPDSSVMFTSFNGSIWETVSVDQGYSGTGNTLSLAFDNNGDPGIAYAYYDQEDPSVLRFAKRENGSWSRDTVNSDDHSYSNKCTLAFSSTGVPFIGYGYFTDTYGDTCNMYYSWLDENTAQWQMELVDDPMTKTAYQTSTMALDTNDNPHFVYSANDDDSLRYAFKNGESFSFLTVENADRIGHYSSLVIDDENVPHLAYCAFSGESDLKYGVLQGNSWVTSVADSQGDVGTFPSIALDPSGNPCVSYLEADDYDLQYACKNEEKWDVQTVPIEGKRRGSFPEIALDSKGEPSLVYMLQDTRAMLFASKDGNEWERSTIISFEDLDSGHYLRDPSYIIDEDDNDHLLFVSDDVLTYGVRTLDAWDFESVSSDIECWECDLALDSSVGPHAAFNMSEYLVIPSGMSSSAQYTSNLWYGTKIDSGWEFERIDIGRVDNIDMVLSEDEKAFICYFEDNEDELKYCVQNEVSWDIGVVSSDLRDVHSLSLEMDSSGIPHLAFISTNQTSESVPLRESEVVSYSYTLNHAIFSGNDWIIEKVDDLKFSGGVRQIKMVFDSLDNPQIVYGTGSFGIQGGTDSDIKAELRYAWFDGESWNKVMLDENYLTSFASYSTVILDSNDVPHIAYFTGTGLNYGTLTFEDVTTGGGSCNIGTLPAAFGLLMVPLLYLLRR